MRQLTARAWLIALTMLFTGLPALAETGGKPAPSKNGASGKPAAGAKDDGRADYRSQHFMMHTDITAAEAKELLAKLEIEFKLISAYWGRPPVGIVECYVVRDLSKWPADSMDPEGRRKIEEGAGVTLTDKLTTEKGFTAKSVVYAAVEHETVQHEAVHAYCGQTFGGGGPLWYSEGMAEMGHFWKEGDKGVNCAEYIIKYIHETKPKSLNAIVNAKELTGDSWQNYAWRWALCHLLANNPNYSDKFRPLGLAYLTKQPLTFEQAYGAMAEELQFEYTFFLEHVDLGYRVDLCAWDWKHKFHGLTGPAVISAKVLAEHGWQATGLTVAAGTQYEFTATGTWQTTKDGPELTADGDSSGKGRLVGVVLHDFTLGEPFGLGAAGSFKANVEGKLFVRCQDKWNELADNKGAVTMKIKLKTDGSPSPPTEVKSASSESAHDSR